jgi:hypothetical protein
MAFLDIFLFIFLLSITQGRASLTCLRSAQQFSRLAIAQNCSGMNFCMAQ